MSPPCGSPELATSTLLPWGVTAKIRPLVSSEAIRSPPKRPNVAGATAIPPSTRGALLVIVVTAPWQSIASTLVLGPWLTVTSSRWPKPPVSSNAIPSSSPGAMMLANRRTRPLALIATTPRPACRRSA